MNTTPGWTEKRLDAVVSLRRGYDLPATSRKPGRYKVLSSGGVSGTHCEARVLGPGFSIGRATNLGMPTWSDEDYWPLNTTLFVEDFHGNVPRYCYYLFQSLDLTGFNSGSVQPMLNRNYIAGVKLAIPPIEEQRGIAATLGALDDKVESNRRLITLIPALIRAHVDASVASACDNVSVSELAEFINGGAHTKGASGTGRVVIRIAELNSGIGGSTVFSDADVPDNHVAEPGTILMAWSGSLGVYRWSGDEAIINQHIFKVIPAGYPSWLVFDRVDSVMPEFRQIARDKATTMGHIQRRHLIETTVKLPTRARTTELDQAMSPLWERLLLAEHETRTLAELRDTLLPELMSGRIRVPEAREAVDAAG